MISIMSDTGKSLDARRKRLLWRAEHRGIREMDLLMGSFARRFLGGMDERELDQFEVLVGLPDLDLYNWLIGHEEVPANVRTPTYDRLKAHHFDRQGYAG